MPGPAQPWDQSEDPRENTMDLPRVNLAGLADYFRGAAPPPRPAAPVKPSAGLAEPSAELVEPPAGQAEPPAQPDHGPQADSHSQSGTAARSAADRLSGTGAAVGTAGAGTAAEGTSGASPNIARAITVTSGGETAAGSGLPSYAPAVRPVPGSLADLRSRLARLPAGHPSSPYDDGGQARPLPTRLKHLELGLPAPGREIGDLSARGDLRVWEAGLPDPAAAAAGDHAANAAADHAANAAAAVEQRAEPPERGGDRPLEDDSHGRQAASPEPEPRAEDVEVASGHNGSSERHGDLLSPRWQDPYAVDSADNGYPRRAIGSGTRGDLGDPDNLELLPWTGESHGPGRRAANGGANGNGHRLRTRPENGREDVGPADRDWRERDRSDVWPVREQDPDRGLAPDRSLPPDRSLRPPDRQGFDSRRAEPRPQDTIQRRAPRPDSRRSDAAQRSDASRSSASPPDTPLSDADGLSGLVERTLAACRAAEGRNMFGSYGSSGITPVIHRLAAQLPAGGLAPGSEADSLKPAARFAAKLAKLIARNPGRTPEELAASISDAVRYAFAFEADDYTECTWLVHRRLKTQGFELEARRNRWESPEHKGIFTRWRDPAHGVSFEVQFHTMASWAAAQRNHDSYVRITDPATPAAERAQLRARQVLAAATAAAPAGCMDIGDFRAEQR